MILIYPSHHFAPDLASYIETDHAIAHPQSETAFEQALSEADILITNQWNETWNQYLDGIAFIQISSAGYDHLPIETFQANDVTVANASGVHAEPIAEHVFAYLLADVREVFDKYHAQNEHHWQNYNDHRPAELAGTTMTIIGVGAIGTEIADKAQAFEMTVIGIDPDQNDDYAIDRWHSPDTVQTVLPETDHLVLACPLTAETRGMIGTEELDALPDDATVTNIARGPVIEREALKHALENDTLGTVILDVTWTEPLPADSPFWDFDACYITPHISGLSEHYGRRLGRLFMENLAALKDNRSLPTQIDE